jgi:hypothetical protein
LLTGIGKYAGQKHRRRASSPKLLALNTGLISALMGTDFTAAHKDHKTWGRLVESAVGAHLVNTAAADQVEVYYWNEGSSEVDYILAKGKQLTTIEVKSQPGTAKISGMASFCKQFPINKQLIVGGQGIALEDFLSKPAAHWLE